MTKWFLAVNWQISDIKMGKELKTKQITLKDWFGSNRSFGLLEECGNIFLNTFDYDHGNGSVQSRKTRNFSPIKEILFENFMNIEKSAKWSKNLKYGQKSTFNFIKNTVKVKEITP